MRVFDCRDGVYIPLTKIYEVYKETEFPNTIIHVKSADGPDDYIVVSYDTIEQRDAAFKDAFDVVGKTPT